MNTGMIFDGGMQSMIAFELNRPINISTLVLPSAVSASCSSLVHMSRT